ncbi:MAG: hypothetical protein IJY47_05950 [Clostridia bacterium]|nr:hypothetical protein [Clostridia bacterium]
MEQVSPEGSYDHLRVVGVGDCGCRRHQDRLPPVSVGNVRLRTCHEAKRCS